MLPGIGGIAGRAGGGLLSRVNMVSTTDNSLSDLVGGTIPASYSYIEIICEAGPGAGYAKSTFTSSSPNRPTPGAAITATIDRRASPGNYWSTFSCAGLAAYPTAYGSASSGGARGESGQTNSGTLGTAWRIQVNYIP